MSNGIPQFTVKYYLLGFPLGRPTTHSATSCQRRKRVNDILMTRFVGILIRSVVPSDIQTARRPAILRDRGEWNATGCCVSAAPKIYLGWPLSFWVPLWVTPNPVLGLVRRGRAAIAACARLISLGSERNHSTHKRKGPGNAEAPSKLYLDILSLATAVTGATAADPSPKPTHEFSPTITAQKRQQLTTCIP